MASEEGLAGALRKLMMSPNAQIKRLAMAVYGNIQDNFTPKPEITRTPAQETTSQSSQPVVGTALETSKMSSARTYHVYIKGIYYDVLVSRNLFLIVCSFHRSFQRSTESSDRELPPISKGRFVFSYRFVRPQGRRTVRSYIDLVFK